MSVLGSEERLPMLVGVSKAIRKVVELTDAVAQGDCCVLIEGESGTGKELVARRLHARSGRCDKPFIPVNCAGVSQTLFESQFFGHMRGAFTGAAQNMLGLVCSADGGTLFMDEVGEIPADLQAKLLRTLQEGEVLAVGATAPVQVNTRFVAATNRSLKQEVRAGRFREDLFYRINVVRIFIPPLRERPEDIEPLLEHFLSRTAARLSRPVVHVGPNVRRNLAAHSWKGNARELSSWVERLYATGLSPEALWDALLGEDDGLHADSPMPEGVQTLQQAERWVIQQAMRSANSNQSEAARLLDIHRGTLSRKLQEYAIA